MVCKYYPTREDTFLSASCVRSLERALQAYRLRYFYSDSVSRDPHDSRDLWHPPIPSRLSLPETQRQGRATRGETRNEAARDDTASDLQRNVCRGTAGRSRVQRSISAGASGDPGSR